MASWREIDRIRKDAAGFRALAKSLLAAPGGELTEWEATFLESVACNKLADEYSTRQSEKLLQIRDDAQTIDTVRDFSVRALIDGCFEASTDLSEEDEEWIVALHARDPASIKRRDAGRPLRYARQLGLVEGDFAS